MRNRSEIELLQMIIGIFMYCDSEYNIKIIKDNLKISTGDL